MLKLLPLDVLRYIIPEYMDYNIVYYDSIYKIYGEKGINKEILEKCCDLVNEYDLYYEDDTYDNKREKCIEFYGLCINEFIKLFKYHIDKATTKSSAHKLYYEFVEYKKKIVDII